MNEFDKIATRIGLHKLSTDEFGRFFPKRSSFYAYVSCSIVCNHKLMVIRLTFKVTFFKLTCDQEIQQMNVYVSNNSVMPQKENTFLFGLFAKRHKYDKVVILLKDSRNKVSLKCFVNLPANDTLAILPGCGLDL